MTENKEVPFRAFMPVMIVFLAVNMLAIVFRSRMETVGFDQPLLIYGNLLLFGVTLFSWFFHRSAIQAGNTQVFLRNVYSAMLLKLFVCIVAFFIYAYFAGSDVNKPSLFLVMFLYLVYTFSELGILIKHSKKRDSNG